MDHEPGVTESPLEGSVQRIDPTTNEVVATIPAGPTPRFLAAGEGGVWTLNWGDGSVTRIDPDTNELVSNIPLGMEGGGGDIATGGGRVWVRGTKVLLASIDPLTNLVTTLPRSSRGERCGASGWRPGVGDGP